MKPEKLKKALTAHYHSLIAKNSLYQNGDDDFALSTEEIALSRALTIVLTDLKKKE